MAGPPQNQEQWQRSSIGITPVTVRPRPGTRRIKKQDLVGTEIITKNAHAHTLGGAGAAGGRREGGIKGAGRVCSVCTRASADYSCPRCLIGYCSSNCYKTHGSSCTEAFFRGHVERETRLREAEATPFGREGGKGGADGGGGGGGAKEQRRASMIEVLRRSRRNVNKIGKADELVGGGDGDGCLFRDDGGADSNDEELALQERRLNALALALTSRGHTLAPAAAVHENDTGSSASGRQNVDDGHGDMREYNRKCGVRAEEEEEGGGRVEGRQGLVGGSCDEDDTMMSLLTEDERARFLREVASGRLGKLIVPWVPWWKQVGGVQEVSTAAADNKLVHHSCCQQPPVVPPSLAFAGTKSSRDSSCPPTQPTTPEQAQPSYASDGIASASPAQLPPGTVGGAVVVGQVDTDEENCARHSFAALLTRALQAPNFSTLCARPPAPTLPALAADVIYAYALAVRLYNGCWCSDPVGASLAFVGASPALKDGATPSDVTGALSACVERAVEGEGVSYRGYAESLLQDVLSLCSDARKLTCAFQDAWGMLEAAGRTLAPSNPDVKASASSTSSSSRSTHLKKSQRRAAKELGKVEKRVGYFLLWARSHGAEMAPGMAAAVKRVAEIHIGRGRDGLGEEGLLSTAAGV